MSEIWALYGTGNAQWGGMRDASKMPVNGYEHETMAMEVFSLILPSSSMSSFFPSSTDKFSWWRGYLTVSTIHYLRPYSSVVGPDPDPYGSAFIWLTWIWIRIQEHGNWPKFTNKHGFLHFLKAFLQCFCFPAKNCALPRPSLTTLRHKNTKCIVYFF